MSLFLLLLSVVMKHGMLMLVDRSHAVLNQAQLSALWHFHLITEASSYGEGQTSDQLRFLCL